MNLNPISFDVDDEELTTLVGMSIDPCAFCTVEFKLDEARWVFGEREVEDGDWEDIIAFGCPKCEAMGPASKNRHCAMGSWNAMVMYRHLYESVTKNI